MGGDEGASISPWVKKGPCMILLQLTSIFQVLHLWKMCQTLCGGLSGMSSPQCAGDLYLKDDASPNPSKEPI